jgi:hypothetical protein
LLSSGVPLEAENSVLALKMLSPKSSPRISPAVSSTADLEAQPQKDPGGARSRTSPPRSTGDRGSRAKSNLVKDHLERERDLRIQKAKARRGIRLVSMCLLLAISFGVWCGVTLPNAMLSIEKSFDTELGVILQVDGCDVDVREGTSPRIKYRALLRHYKASWTYRGGDAEVVQAGFLSNPSGCDEMPYFQCRQLCLVTVEVPPGATGALRIDQTPEDQSYPRLVVHTSLASLTVGGGSITAPTMRVEVRPGVTVGSLSAYLVGGELRATRATIGSLTAYAQPATSCPGPWAGRSWAGGLDDYAAEVSRHA